MNMEMQKIFNTLCKILGKKKDQMLAGVLNIVFLLAVYFFSVIYRLKT